MCIYPYFYWFTFGLFPGFDYYKQHLQWAFLVCMNISWCKYAHISPGFISEVELLGHRMCMFSPSLHSNKWRPGGCTASGSLSPCCSVVGKKAVGSELRVPQIQLRRKNFCWEINPCATRFLSLCHLGGLSATASLPRVSSLLPNPGSLHHVSLTNLVKGMVGDRHLEGGGSHPLDKKPEESVQARDLSRAGGRVELSCLWPEADGFSWNPGTSSGRRYKDPH